MSARHRGKADYSAPIARIATVVVPLAGIGFLIFLGLTHSPAIFIILGAGNVIFIIQAVHRVVLNLADKHPQTADRMADRLGLIANLVVALVMALAFVGEVRGWMHGTFRVVVLGVLGLYLLGAPIYWYGGRRRLIEVLRTRATGESQGDAA